MRRREFIAIVGGAAAWPVLARAQQPARPVLGFLNSASPKDYADPLRAFLQGLGDAGYDNGRNVVIEYRWAEGQYDRLPQLTTDLIERRVAVIAATSTPAALVAKSATTTIPVVFTTASDPVELGLVSNLSRPGANVTGATQLTVEVGPKRLELAHELFPSATVLALLVNPTSPVAGSISKTMQGAAATLGLQLHVLRAGNESEIDEAFAAAARLGASVLLIASDAYFNSRDEQLGALTLRHKIPTIYQYRMFAAAGGLMSYGGSITGAYRQAGIYCGRILKGDKPADLPVVQATNIELVINLATAKALGITIPHSVLLRADEVID
ncbi:MAG TPA: ABC transporter substrate-binding protein [Stellaceae bacterium]|nr:ABC transporter substrate-binding protein [Stellaceae bacterium]